MVGNTQKVVALQSHDDVSFLHPYDAGWPGRKYITQHIVQNATQSSDFQSTSARLQLQTGPKSRSAQEHASYTDISNRHSNRTQRSNTTDMLDSSHDSHKSKQKQLQGPSPVKGEDITGLLRQFDKPVFKFGDTTSVQPVETGMERFGTYLPGNHSIVRSETVTDLFHDLANSLRQLTKDIVTDEAEAKKLKTFTDLAFVLSKTSPPAANLINPALTDVLLRSAQSRQRVDQCLVTIDRIWQNVMDDLVRRISQTIDEKLEMATTAITQRLRQAGCISERSIMENFAGTTVSQGITRKRFHNGNTHTEDERRRWKRYRESDYNAPARQNFHRGNKGVEMIKESDVSRTEVSTQSPGVNR
ncbi:hypothetical protein AMATHDRAFT_640 [Amanita thiersii Skay4041]|uniref:Uncharacterized protein n=1 Tax=Amanita thiersii Skay4041 TaxID=703135 RepID=A0A2A9NXX5_9AGAR|nr:hypothetical protein AMATHDRAFT_640 [Amanita thiersii Skay4041]